MTFRTRVLLASIAVAVAPLIVFGLGARRTVGNQLTEQYSASVAASRSAIQDKLTTQDTAIAQTLRSLAQQLDAQPHLRAGLLGHADRTPILDFAPSTMRQVGLDYLVLLDSTGTILSSGSFRNDFDRRTQWLQPILAATGPVLLHTRRPDASYLALARARAFNVGDQRFALAGGVRVDSAFVRALIRPNESGVVAALAFPGDTLRSDTTTIDLADAWSENIVLPYVDDVGDAATPGEAQLTIAHSRAPLRAILARMDRWMVFAALAALLLAIVIARMVAARVNRPLEELASKTTQVNLEQLDVEFATERTDEIGSLARLLDAMVQRLRASVTQWRAAERRATIGDLARQVNHDVRNGLLPIRNVIGHLSEVAHVSPKDLADVFVQREATLQTGIAYLENLAGNYARLSPRTERKPCDLNSVVRGMVGKAGDTGTLRLELELTDNLPRVHADPVALRRIVENLTINALESLENRGGTVTLKTNVINAGAERRVLLTVADTGKGIDPAALDRVFDDFYTTKERGSGLGLSIVRRLVGDMGGRIGVQSQPGRGTTFRIELPVVG